jgi:hypothetical protein
VIDKAEDYCHFVPNSSLVSRLVENMENRIIAIHFSHLKFAGGNRTWEIEALHSKAQIS